MFGLEEIPVVRVIHVSPSVSDPPSSARWFVFLVIRGRICVTKKHMFYIGTSRSTRLAKIIFALERSSFGHVIGICSFVLSSSFSLFCLLSTLWIKWQHSLQHANCALNLFSRYNSTDGYQTRGSQHVRFCCLDEVHSLQKKENLSTKVRGVELLFWSSDFCVSPVISAEIDSASRWS